MSGGRVGALVIHGPTGIGKSRLLHEVAGYGRAAGWRVLEWQALESASAPAYGPIGGELADGLGAELVETWSEPARSGIAAVAPGLTLQGTITFADRAALLEALACALAETARERPLVLAIDDIPWLDPSTLELLERVVADRMHASILVAATSRDDEPVPEPAQRFLERVHRAGGMDLALGPLGPSDIEPLIVGNLGGVSVQPELARRTFELSDGNPLFCLELVRAGRDRGRVRLAGERWSVVPFVPLGSGQGYAGASATGEGTLAPEEMPESVRRLVADRSARLSGPTLELVGTAAELGARDSVRLAPGNPGRSRRGAPPRARRRAGLWAHGRTRGRLRVRASVVPAGRARDIRVGATGRYPPGRGARPRRLWWR